MSIYCLPVTCANSTISAPKTENALTNSVKFATDSSLPNDFATCNNKYKKILLDLSYFITYFYLFYLNVATMLFFFVLLIYFFCENTLYECLKVGSIETCPEMF